MDFQPSKFTEDPLRRKGSEQHSMVVPDRWLNVWTSVYLDANVSTYEYLLRSADTGKAYRWIISAGLAAVTFRIGLALLVYRGNANVQGIEVSEGLVLFLLAAAIFIIPTGFTILLTVMTFTASLFGGSSNFDSLAYLGAAIYAPIILLNGIMGIIPGIGSCVSMIVGLYAIYLFTIAIQTAEGLEGITAFISAISPFILLFIGLMCLSSMFAV